MNSQTEAAKAVQTIIKNVLDQATNHINYSKRGDTWYLNNLRLARAQGALDTIQSIASDNPEYIHLRNEINRLWRKAESKPRYNSWNYSGDLYDHLDEEF